MISFVRKLVYIFGLFLALYIGWQLYVYIFDRSCPVVEVVGLEDGGFYSGDIACSICGTHRYKVANLGIWLDGHTLAEQVKVGSRSFDRPLEIPTRTIAQGKHNLMIETVDGTYHRNKTVKQIAFNVDNMPLQGAFIRPETDCKVFQGRILHIPIQFNKPVKQVKVKVFSKEFNAVPELDGSVIYECFIPVGCEEKVSEYPFELVAKDYVDNILTLNGSMAVAAYPFKRQVLHKIDTERFEEEKKLGKSEKVLSELLIELSQKSSAQKLWRGVFYKPLNMTAVMCDFGTKRITQERGCYIHAAIDVIGLLKTVVWAPQDGVVVIKDRFEVTGNTVAIDHGCSVITILCHLDKFADINVGDKISRGNPVGIMGKTGYATGDHLHWEMRVHNTPVDPMQWTKQDF
jgi:hypothetical protein